MFLVFVPILNSLSCSAPEVAPPTRKLSPAEKEGRGQGIPDSNSSNKETSSVNMEINEEIKEKNKDTSNEQDVSKSTMRTTDSPDMDKQEEPTEANPPRREGWSRRRNFVRVRVSQKSSGFATKRVK